MEREASEICYVNQIQANHTRYMYLEQITPNFDLMYIEKHILEHI